MKAVLFVLVTAVVLAQDGLYKDFRVESPECEGTLHALAQSREETAKSIRERHYYCADEQSGDPTGFVFHASNNLGLFDMGDWTFLIRNTQLIAVAPRAAKLKLLRGDAVVHEIEGTRLEIRAREPGSYRIEAWVGEKLWIRSSPIDLKAPDLSILRLPSSELASSVTAFKDLVYSDEDKAKNMLDIYVPKGKTGFPVLFFIHGGAWRSGDKSLYAPLGNRFAKEGIGVVAISYRLAPQHKHPAQIRDTAAAFAWTVRNIEKYGGNREAIFVAGHSAGGHLASLLTLDERYLASHELSRKNIRGTIAMSGVYELRGFENVFASAQQEASPMRYVKAVETPFLITYAQWDYFTLPWQAKQFHAALQSAGVSAELVFAAGQGHISEMVNIVKDDDVTARAILSFLAKLGV